jgi:two-component system, cell cycle sensor histidine kinase and response regulator CckA
MNATLPPISSQEKETILLVEDEEPLRSVMARVLTRYGYGVLEASSGAEALEMWQQHADKIALLLTDMVMPHMSGPELARQLQAEKESLPVIFSTGYNTECVASECLLEEGTNFLSKPYQPADLIRIISQSVSAGHVAPILRKRAVLAPS